MQFYNIWVMLKGKQTVLPHVNKGTTSFTETAQIKLMMGSLFCVITDGFQTEGCLTDASILKQANSSFTVTP